MNLETIDLIQLHCPPTETYNRPEIFDLFNTLKKEGKILNLGVSVEKVEEALKAIEYDNVSTIQIIFNMFRQRPATDFFTGAAKKNIGVIVRVPLASGLLTGKFSLSTIFNPQDHRSFNRNGEAFDKGETFSGINYERGLFAVEEIKKLIFDDIDMAGIALRWILMFPQVSCIIPGASHPSQILSNLKASDLPELSKEQMEGIKHIYDQYIWPDLANEAW
jgi:aryl-alcohol dehydrogenase-like predicted oxidoreductase